ncbi:MAG: winged helix-turn-helix transcriptional regulator [Candidatus Aquicultor sp.]
MNDDEIFLKETKSMLDLRALEEIEKNPKISQRELSNRLGVALGITNSLLKNLVHKGLVKIRGENNRSLTYHLTHAGVLAKSRLAMRWTLNTIEFYRQARRDIADRLEDVARQGVASVLLYGVNELTEVAIIVSSEVGLKVLGIINDEKAGAVKVILEYPAVKLDELHTDQADAIIVCVETDDVRFEELAAYMRDSSRVYRLI